MTAARADGALHDAIPPTGEGFVHYIGPSRVRSQALIDFLRESSFVVERADAPSDLRTALEVHAPIVLLDPVFEGDLLQVAACVLEFNPSARLVALTSRIGRNRFLLALQRGVAGLCDADAGHEAILRTVIDVRDRGAAIPRHLVPLLVDQLRHGRGHHLETNAGDVELTDREWEVLSLLRAGRSTSDIAATLYIAAPTVRSHVSSLVHKFGASDRDALVRLFDDT